MAAAAVIAAARVLVRNKGVRSAAGKMGAGARDAAAETIDYASRVGRAIASAVTGAAR
jgi:hypothetical protein